MKAKSYLFVALALVLMAGIGNAQEPDNNIVCINQFFHNWQVGVFDVCVQGNYAYLACGYEGMRIIDISDPADYRDVSQMVYSGARSVMVEGNYAYVGCTWDDVPIVDISDPTSPQEIGRIPMQGLKPTIKAKDNYIFICSDWRGLKIADISDPASPQDVWQGLDTAEVNDIDIQGNVAYVATKYAGMVVLDITDPASTQIIADNVPFNYEEVMGVSVAGNYAYLSAGDAGLQVVDLTTMEMVAQIDSLAYAFKARVSGDYVYLSYGNPECPLAIVDIADPLEPQTVSIYYPPQDISSFIVDDDLVYVADFEHCLRVLDVSDPMEPFETYVYNRYGQDLDVVLYGDYAYVKEDYKLKLINIADLQRPFEVGYYECGWYTSRLHISGDVGFMSRSSNPCLVAVDLNDPNPSNLLGTFSADNNIGRDMMGFYDHYAYLDYGNRILIVDVSDPANMQQVGWLSVPTGAWYLDSYSHYLIYQNSELMLIALDLSDPEAPTQIASYQMDDYIRDMAFANDKLYASSLEKLYIFDIVSSDNWSPLVAEELFTDDRNLRCLEVNGKYLYITDYEHGLSLFDMTDIHSPQLVGSIETPGYGGGLCVRGDTVIMADISNLGFYDCSPVVTDIDSEPVLANAFALLPNYPNPFNSSTNIRFELPESGHVTLTVFDMLGRAVSTLIDGEYQAGQHTVRWDGTGSQGSSVASGRYFVQAKLGDRTASRPIVLLK